MSKKKIYFVGGSFDPFHNDHDGIVQKILSQVPGAEVWIAPCYNPWKNKGLLTLEQRIEVIEKIYKNHPQIKVLKEGFTYTVDFVRKYSKDYDLVLAMGQDTFDTKEKWKDFSEVKENVSDFFVVPRTIMSSTEIRENLKDCYGKVPVEVYNYLLLNFIEFKKPSLTGDAIIQRQDGKILVFERTTEPYRGSWVFPGGFVDENEHPQQAAIREVEEEVGISIGPSDKVTYLDTFYQTGRDPRGWVVTQSYVVNLSYNPQGVETTEARNLSWVSPQSALELNMGFDHREALKLAISRGLI